jgi:hypothetical protein
LFYLTRKAEFAASHYLPQSGAFPRAEPEAVQQMQWPEGSGSVSSGNHEGVTLRQAALIAGFAYLLGPVTYAEFSIYPKLVMPANIAQTVQNIATHRGLFATAIYRNT